MSFRPRLGFTAIVVTVLILILTFSATMKPVERVFRWILLPIARVFAIAGSGVRDLVYRSDDTVCHAQTTDLEARLQTLTVDYVQLRALEEENRSLRLVNKFLSDSGFDTVSARVIARQDGGDRSNLLIDRGSNDGLETGMAVVVGEGVYIGKISSLNERVATVTLISDQQSRTAVALSGEGRLIGVLEGKGNNVALVNFIPQAQAIQRDQVIVTAGTENKIPPHLTIALVNDVQGLPTDPFKSAITEPLVRTEEVRFVSIIRPSALRPDKAGSRP